MSPLKLRRRFEGLGLSLLISLALLGASVWYVYRELEAILGASKITRSISWVAEFNPPLISRLAVFGGAVLLSHMGFAIVVWALARMTRAAFPGRARSLPGHIVVWAGVAASLVLLVNAASYPASRFANIDFGLPAAWNGTPLSALILGAVGLVVLTIAAIAYQRADFKVVRWRNTAIVTLLVAGAIWVLPLVLTSRSQASTAPTSPHVVILGVDSLRSDLSEAEVGKIRTPHIDHFLAQSREFVDTVSPLARTFPAWVSILTGRHPVSTNARFNLMPRGLVNEGDTLADALKRHGYRSVFATDEVRFANFDESYGFDELITPPVGASDFVLGAVADQPLVNVIAGSRLGEWIFPQIHANRANAVTYDPDHFVERLERKLEVGGPSFLAIHLTLAHWPYSWAGQEIPTTPQAFRPAYRRALEEVDRQFQEVLELLERKGVLQNAIVVVLSDHGEALGFRSDTILRKAGSHREIWDSLWGHGTSVVSPHQYGVVLAMRAYGRARLPGMAGQYDWPVALEDVRPTLEELATGRSPSQVDGMSLVPYMKDPADAAALRDRIRYTETCFNTIKMLDGKITASGVVSEAGIYYELSSENGWVQLRPDRLHEIMAKKQYAAVSRDALLAAIPSWTDQPPTYIYSTRRSPAPRRLSQRPEPATDPEAARLWEALERRFPGELPSPGQVPRM